MLCRIINGGASQTRDPLGRSSTMEVNHETYIASLRFSGSDRITPVHHGATCGDANARTTIETANGGGETSHAGTEGQKLFAVIQR